MNAESLRAKRFATPAEVAAFFGDTDVRTVRRAVEEGELPSVRLGSKILIPTAPLLAMLAVPEENAPPAPASAAVPEDAVRVAVSTIRGALDALDGLLSITSGIDGPGTHHAQGIRAARSLVGRSLDGDVESPPGGSDAA